MTCKKCGAQLLTPRETDRALCESCAARTMGRCVKCGGPLTASHPVGDLCPRCEISNTSCMKCGGALYTSEERKSGVCQRCRLH